MNAHVHALNTRTSSINALELQENYYTLGSMAYTKFV